MRWSIGVSVINFAARRGRYELPSPDELVLTQDDGRLFLALSHSACGEVARRVRRTVPPLVPSTGPIPQPGDDNAPIAGVWCSVGSSLAGTALYTVVHFRPDGTVRLARDGSGASLTCAGHYEDTPEGGWWECAPNVPRASMSRSADGHILTLNDRRGAYVTLEKMDCNDISNFTLGKIGLRRPPRPSQSPAP